MVEKRNSSSSKELLQLEKKSSTTPLESRLSICNENNLPETPTQKPTMFPVPKSQVLGKLKDFLGVMAESNKKLQSDAKNNPDKYDIEVLDGQESECIEMDLMLGVADLHTPEAVAAAESAIAGNQPPVNLAEESSTDTETDDSSDDDDKEDDETTPAKEIGTKRVEKDSSCKSSKKQNLKKRQKIVELC